MRKHFLRIAGVLLLGACAQPPVPTPIVVTPPAEQASAPVVRRDLPETMAPAPVLPPVGDPAAIGLPPPPAVAALPPITLPGDAIYVCVIDKQGTRHQTAIEFVPKVHSLCRRHPEMGPCQYERNICRAAGGRVFAGKGQEITLATEAEYDRKVMRVRFRSN